MSYAYEQYKPYASLKEEIADLNKKLFDRNNTIRKLRRQKRTFSVRLRDLEGKIEKQDGEINMSNLLHCKDVKSQESELNIILDKCSNLERELNQLTSNIKKLMRRSYCSIDRRTHKRSKSMNEFTKIDLDSLSLELLSKFEYFADKQGITRAQMIKHVIRRKHKQWHNWNFSETLDFILAIRGKNGEFICGPYKSDLNLTKRNYARTMNITSEGKYVLTILDDDKLREFGIRNIDDINIIKQEINKLTNKMDVADMFRKFRKFPFQKRSLSLTSISTTNGMESVTTPTPHNVNIVISNNSEECEFENVYGLQSGGELGLSLICEGKQCKVSSDDDSGGSHELINNLTPTSFGENTSASGIAWPFPQGAPPSVNSSTMQTKDGILENSRIGEDSYPGHALLPP